MNTYLCLIFVLCPFSIFALNPFPGENWNTGYIDVGEGSYLFYYLFRSRNHSNPKPPLVIWLEGGPGFSTSFGVFTEGGPYVVNNKTKEIEKNPFAWNEVADTLFVDQPAGVHFSYALKEERICSSETCVSNDFYKFLQGFVELYPEYKGRPLYVSGVSYGGHYVPAIAGKLMKENNKDFNLKGIAIGNGMVDLYTQLPSYPAYLLKVKYINLWQYIKFNTAVTLCHIMHKFGSELFDFPCSVSLFTMYHNLVKGFDPYDIYEKNPTYDPYRVIVEKYLNVPEVQEALGVNQTFRLSNDTVFEKMKPDWKTSLSGEVIMALERGVKVYLFFGDADYVCNWVGGEYLTDSLKWSGQKEFHKSTYKPWLVDGTELGKHKTHKNLSLIQVYGAGHTIFFKHREFALEMLKALIDYQLYQRGEIML
eukprot:TRINITY_DN135828_c0_g1_i1.p2 TRINITY_DN135828_c0_g1~~TRINITY_DN135828_c0_g1_i1.p2  ORF type:complete len:422 (-),score=43.87 TRINITY_DN135828_c0_g1_i1:705-1970(-)